MTFRYLTTCSGVEAVTLGWAPLGARAVAYSDYDPDNDFPSRFLKERFPETPNLGDMLKIDGRLWRGRVDVLWGSTPCQSFSLGGLRKGIKDPRGALTPALVGLANEIAPKVLCWENVDGVLTDGDNAFGCFLAALAGSDTVLVAPGNKWPSAGYVVGPERRVAWRLLDAKHFFLPQQRRRVFLVACPVDGPDPREVLFEGFAPFDTLGERRESWAPVVERRDVSADAYACAIRGRKHGQQFEQGGLIANCLRASQGGSDKPQVLAKEAGEQWRVRNMTPVEAERCMGMPDDWTLITGASDSDRYHAIGNSLAVPCVRYIGERLLKVLG
ncbi:DNA methyltransferase [Caulobacter phage CcrBL9]|uniref:Cytosine-specific DNA methyltransferase n=1 Tax=Caulobacter phage CcrBL9 TaxID=2283270 RepID=A0A385EBE2_9CAUD|nr:DNA methyltransferase [Caulobacter phage CcrBL9]AXQ69211.1 cytosine-specific DNA methyltransferase [Caulobacter phage CcrBL9]